MGADCNKVQLFPVPIIESNERHDIMDSKNCLPRYGLSGGWIENKKA